MDIYEGQFHLNVIASDTQAMVCSGFIIFGACFKCERTVLGYFSMCDAAALAPALCVFLYCHLVVTEFLAYKLIFSDVY